MNPSARSVLLFLLFAFLLASATLSVAQKTGPIVTLTPSTLDFGNQLVNTVSLTKSITLTNTGDAPLIISFIRPDPPGTYQQFSDCGASLAAGASCTIRAMFSPTVAGSVPGAVILTTNAPGNPQKATLTGVGTASPVTLSPTSLDFGSIPLGSSSSVQKVTLSNQGTSALSITSISTSSGAYSDTHTCPSSLAVGASCTISLTFTPSGPGPNLATLSVADSDSTGEQRVALTGAATSGAATISPSTAIFALQSVGTTSAPKTVTLTNSGTTDLGIVSIIASGDYAQSNACGSTLAPGASCNISVTFSPSGIGTRRGFITVSHSGSASLSTGNLRGSGFIRTSTITVSPKAPSVTFTQKQQMQAFLNGLPTSDVVWSVDNIVGGNTTVGTITTGGLYTPPSTVGTHRIKAASTSDATQTGIASLIITNNPGVFTFHNDNARTGQNLGETVLTTGNVNKNQFGKLFSYAVDGLIRGTPLYVANVQMPNQEFHNIVFVTTEHDSVYAFDADGLSTTPLWQLSFIDPANGINPVPAEDVNVHCPGIGFEFGVSSTPVIDPSTNRIFVLSRTKDSSSITPVYHQKLHALDFATGAEAPGSPVEISASVTGFGEGSDHGILAFDPLKEHSKVGLSLANGVVYMGWASICDNHPYHGWVLGYDANTLAQVSVHNTSPNGQAAGIWHSGSGLAIDDQQNIYFETSNGLNTLWGGGVDYGQSIVKLSSTNNSLSVADFFTPFDATFLTQIDSDLSAFGIMLVPDQTDTPKHMLTAGNKKFGLYLLDRDNLGGFTPTDNSRALQAISIPGGCPLEEGNIFGVTAYWQHQVFVWPCGVGLYSHRLYQGFLSASPIATGPLAGAYPPPFPSVSANGDTNGIVWGINEHGYSTNTPAILFAFDAANISRVLYTSDQAGTRDQAGIAAKGPTPMIVNGKVYLGANGELDVYGLLP